jgi:hypothetical protein
VLALVNISEGERWRRKKAQSNAAPCPSFAIEEDKERERELEELATSKQAGSQAGRRVGVCATGQLGSR